MHSHVWGSHRVKFDADDFEQFLRNCLRGAHVHTHRHGSVYTKICSRFANKKQCIWLMLNWTVTIKKPVLILTVKQVEQLIMIKKSVGCIPFLCVRFSVIYIFPMGLSMLSWINFDCIFFFFRNFAYGNVFSWVLEEIKLVRKIFTSVLLVSICVPPEGRLWISDDSPLSGISGLSVWYHFSISPRLFFCLVL